MENYEVMNIEGIMLLLKHIAILRVRVWFGIVENLAVDVLLGTSFIN